MPPAVARSPCVRLWAVFAAAALVACAPDRAGNGPEDTTADAGPQDAARVVTAENFDAALADAYCGFYTRCLPGRAAEPCTRLASGPRRSLPDELAAGRLAFDASAATACVERVASASCAIAPWDFRDAACAAAFVAKVEPGGICFANEECIGGYCSSFSCPGLCAAWSARGEPCNRQDCAPLDYCYEGSCTARKADGARCTWWQECASGRCVEDACVPLDANPTHLEEGASCDRDDTCAAGLFCGATDTSSGGTCLKRLASGAACGVDFAGDLTLDDCAPGLACVGAVASAGAAGITVTLGRCSPWRVARASCTPVPEGALRGVSGCRPGLVCGADGVCGAPPASGRCSLDASGRCAASSWCDLRDSTCKPRLAVGERCESSEGCASGVCEQDSQDRKRCVAACTGP